MKDEMQVCSFELAKKLKELGVKQEGWFWYIKHIGENYHHYVTLGMPHFTFTDHNNLMHETPIWEIPTWEIFPAYTVAELLDLMPLVNGCPVQLIKGATIDKGIMYCARYDNLQLNYSSIETLPDKNPANALAKMLIMLMEEEHIKL